MREQTFGGRKKERMKERKKTKNDNKNNNNDKKRSKHNMSPTLCLGEIIINIVRVKYDGVSTREDYVTRRLIKLVVWNL